MPVRRLHTIALELVWGGFLLLSSLYCLLAFLPYTNSALIKAPPYDWVPWFVRHHWELCWLMLLVAFAAFYRSFARKALLLLFVPQALLVVSVSLVRFMPRVDTNWETYVWSLTMLSPLPVTTAFEFISRIKNGGPERTPPRILAHSTAVAVGIVTAVVWIAGAGLRILGETHEKIAVRGTFLETSLWSILTHVFVAVLVVSVLNLISLAAGRTRRPRMVHQLAIALVVFGLLWFWLARFMSEALSFEGWRSQLYAGCLAASLVLFGFSLVSPLVRLAPADSSQRPKLPAYLVAGFFAAACVALPSLIGGGDWNGVIQHTLALLFWIAIGACAYRIRPQSARYSFPAVIVAMVICLAAYKSLQASAIYWSKPLGETDDDIALALENYASRDASFQLAHHALGNGRRAEPCGDLCRITRQYTNITGFKLQNEVALVDQLTPSPGNHPDIFIFVVDSMRPDYLGAYNPRVNFTPNLDQFARESVVFRNAFTQYAGTALSEPAIWAGAQILHDHDLSDFDKVNSLAKLARHDGYQIAVSYDTLLRQIFPSAPEIVKFDKETLWNRFEVCSTVAQLEQYLDSRSSASAPVLFFTQPMNVHQFARNDLPSARSEQWEPPSGFDYRISHEVHQIDACMGGFITYLKQRGMYDNSVVVLTSDHGDATGQFGRYSHSLIIYPEVIRVPLLIHLPRVDSTRLVHDDNAISALTDITPSLYYLLGHRPIVNQPLYGRPLFTESASELAGYRRESLFLASDVRAVYGILDQNGRHLYTTYDSPPQSMLFDLTSDPNAEHNILTPALKRKYDQEIIGHLHQIGDFYGYKPGVGSLLANK